MRMFLTTCQLENAIFNNQIFRVGEILTKNGISTLIIISHDRNINAESLLYSNSSVLAGPNSALKQPDLRRHPPSDSPSRKRYAA